MCLSRASGPGEAEGTREGGFTGPDTGTSLDLTCLFGLEACGTGGGGEAAATWLYIAAPVKEPDAVAEAGATADGGAGVGARGVVAPEALGFLG